MSATGRGAIRHKDDFYATPEWATKALINRLRLQKGMGLSALDPCCGDGAILRVLVESFSKVTGYEIDEARAQKATGVTGVLCLDALGPMYPAFFDWVITNPPYNLVQKFVEMAHTRTGPGGSVVMLLRIGFYGSQKRAAFWKKYKPVAIFMLPKRPCFTDDGKTDACEYAWFWWHPDRKNEHTIIERLDP